MNENEWPALKHLFKSYFHQDWKLESEDGSVKGIFQFFIKNEGPDIVKAASKELLLFKGLNLGAAEKRQMLFDFGCEYSLPEGDEFHIWLEAACKQLQTVR